MNGCRLSGITIAASLSGSIRDFLKLSFDMFRASEILAYASAKIQVMSHNYVIVVTSQNFWLPLCRIHQA